MHKELSRQIEELEDKKKALGVAILQKMQSQSLKMVQYVVKRITRLSLKLSLEAARALNATKMQEIIDKDIVKMFYSKSN